LPAKHLATGKATIAGSQAHSVLTTSNQGLKDADFSLHGIAVLCSLQRIAASAATPAVLNSPDTDVDQKYN
jgi:hypothetical protein